MILSILLAEPHTINFILNCYKKRTSGVARKRRPDDAGWTGRNLIGGGQENYFFLEDIYFWSTTSFRRKNFQELHFFQQCACRKWLPSSICLLLCRKMCWKLFLLRLKGKRVGVIAETMNNTCGPQLHLLKHVGAILLLPLAILN